ncbi:MAG: YaaA family protein [Thermocrispum sp.]
MLILLPPSETKSTGGDGGPLQLESLSWPELTPARGKLIDAVVALAADVPASRAALGLSANQDAEVARNAGLWSSRTAPALSRYTGVLYDALGAGGFSRFERARAERRLAVASAVFGLLRPADRIPAYRLSGGSTVPGIGSLRRLWRPALQPVLAALPHPLLDLRSGDYAALAPAPQAVTVRVVGPDGKTVSHFNKAYKGKLAAVLACAPREPSTLRGVVSIAGRAGLRLHRTGDRELELLAD